MCSALNKNRWFLFEKVKNYQHFATNIFSHEKSDFWGGFGQKTERAGQIILKLSTMRNQVFERKNLENENFMAVALHAQIGFQRSDQSQSSTPGQTINGGPVLRYFLSETIQAQENGSRGTHFAKFLISNCVKGLTYSALPQVLQSMFGQKT